MNVKADSLKSRAELLRENEQLRTAKRGRDTLAQVQAASRNRATHHEYERMLEAKVAEAHDEARAQYRAASVLAGALLRVSDERDDLKAQVAALSAPVSDSELELIWQSQGVLYRPEMRSLMDAFVAYRVSKLTWSKESNDAK